MGMVRNNHFAFAPKIKIIMWAVVLIGLWRLYESDFVANAALAFIFGGVVPGTSIILSPDAVITAVWATAAGVMALIVARIIFVRWRRNRKIADELLAAETRNDLPELAKTEEHSASQPEAVTETVNGEPEIASATEVKPTRHYTFAQNFFLLFGGVIVRLLSKSGRIGVWLKNIMLRAKVIVLATAKLIADVTVIAAEEVVLSSKKLWAWLEPRIRKLDAWLAKNVHKAAVATKKRISRHDDLKFGLDIVRETIKMTPRVHLPRRSVAVQEISNDAELAEKPAE